MTGQSIDPLATAFGHRTIQHVDSSVVAVDDHALDTGMGACAENVARAASRGLAQEAAAAGRGACACGVGTFHEGGSGWEPQGGVADLEGKADEGCREPSPHGIAGRGEGLGLDGGAGAVAFLGRAPSEGWSERSP